MKKHYIILALLGVIFTSGFAQKGIPERIGGDLERAPSPKALENRARRSYYEGDYFGAMQYYRRLLRADDRNVAAWEGLAAAATAHTHYATAAAAYEHLRAHQMASDEALLLFRLAEIRYLSGQYADARALYQQVAQQAALPELRQKALNGVRNCDWALQVYQNTADLALDSLRDYINTPFAEYSTRWLNNRLYYSAYGHPYKRDSASPMLQIFSAEPRPDDSVDICRLDINERRRHTAYLAYNRDQTTAYYAVAKYRRSGRLRFQLYRRQRTGDATWSRPHKLPRHINLKDYTTTQPHVATLPGDVRETLFFVSDRPGGKGGKDIWYCYIENGRFSDPINLAALNTEGDDVTPFFHAPTGALYFSSNGRQSLGGFDVYRAEYKDGTWSKVEHLPAPINSSANDVFYSLSENSRLAFFSTNREGAMNFSEEDCCYDIFKIGVGRPEISIAACDEGTGNELLYTTMTLYEVTPEGPKELSRVTVPGSKHTFPLQSGKAYWIVTEKPGYRPDTLQFDMPGRLWDQSFEQRRCLTAIQIDLVVTVTDADSLKPFTGADVLFNTLSFLRPDGQIERGEGGKGLASETRNEPGQHTYRFPLKFQHEYELKAIKPGFSPDSVRVSTVGLAPKNDTTLYRELRLSRGLKLDVYVFDDVLKDPLTDVTITVIELKTPLETRVHRTGPDSNDYHAIIHYETRYRVIATKEGYTRDSAEVNTEALPKLPFQSVERKLYLRPLRPERYLPITLYFDNDRPGPSRIGVTRINEQYKDTYLPYYNRKQEYIDVFCKGMTGAALEAAQYELDTFFERRVKGEWDRMRMFTEVLYEMLENGIEIEIKISGFASPLASAAYNLDLTSRRVSSVFNHFDLFEGGLYKPYIQSGQLKLTREPNGATKAPKTVSADPKDRRMSVYSVDAARERRVEIIGVRATVGGVPLPDASRRR
ncbi:MAG: hypothetical protein RMJ33_07505 [Saprospiraceae bacterium]|nr:hypothetical protein [Saprospiraceae bacterium]MDW8229669.1 hypothetical protein [Saprospiraceae bacterium]